MNISANEKRLVSTSPAETWQIAGDLIASLPRSAVIALHGDLGAGKTCFVQGIAKSLGIDKPVTSPTFTVINEYRGETRDLFHIDLYRLNSMADIMAIGFEDYVNGDGITAVEWAERAGELMPASTVQVRIESTANLDERIITISQTGVNP